MKIFNKENGIEKVYVQEKDIKKLWEFCSNIPNSIYANFNDEEKNGFIEYSSKEEVEFFKTVDWIIDYKKFVKLSKEDLEECMTELQNQMKILQENKNKAKPSIEKEWIRQEYNSLDHKLQDIKTINLMKENKGPFDLPIVPDSDGFSLECDNEDLPYKLSVSLDPNIYLLYRTDGKKLSEEEEYPASFIQTGLSLAFMERKDLPEAGDCELLFDYNEDYSYLIIKMKVIEKTKEEILKHQEEKPKVKGIRRILNRIFYKDK